MTIVSDDVSNIETESESLTKNKSFRKKGKKYHLHETIVVKQADKHMQHCLCHQRQFTSLREDLEDWSYF